MGKQGRRAENWRADASASDGHHGAVAAWERAVETVREVLWGERVTKLPEKDIQPSSSQARTTQDTEVAETDSSQ